MRTETTDRDSSAPGPALSVATRRRQGFTMLEMGVVIVIIGLLMAGGIAGFTAVLEGRRVAQTASMLYKAKECILKRMYFSNRYPSYTGDDTPTLNTDNMNCDGTYGVDYDDETLDVDDCLCGNLDAWGQDLYFLEGRQQGTTDPLSDGTVYVADNKAQNETATAPANTSTIIDKDGNTIQYVAFVIFSTGRDRSMDNSSYRNIFTGSFHAAPIPSGTTPDFSSDDSGSTSFDEKVRDDQYVIVTGPELRSLMTAQ